MSAYYHNVSPVSAHDSLYTGYSEANTSVFLENLNYNFPRYIFTGVKGLNMQPHNSLLPVSKE